MQQHSTNHNPGDFMTDASKMLGERAELMLEEQGGKTEKGGITPTKVNDMILSADGQLIETHEDDNLIIRKGGITQKIGGGGNKDIATINSLLRELIIVSNDTVVEVDGRVVSENYQVA